MHSGNWGWEGEGMANRLSWETAMTVDGFPGRRAGPFLKLLFFSLKGTISLLLSKSNSSPGFVSPGLPAEAEPWLPPAVSSLVCISHGFLQPGSFPSDYNDARSNPKESSHPPPFLPSNQGFPCSPPKLPTPMLALPHFLLACTPWNLASVPATVSKAMATS